MCKTAHLKQVDTDVNESLKERWIVDERNNGTAIHRRGMSWWIERMWIRSKSRRYQYATIKKQANTQSRRKKTFAEELSSCPSHRSSKNLPPLQRRWWTWRSRNTSRPLRHLILAHYTTFFFPIFEVPGYILFPCASFPIILSFIHHMRI